MDQGFFINDLGSISNNFHQFAYELFQLLYEFVYLVKKKRWHFEFLGNFLPNKPMEAQVLFPLWKHISGLNIFSGKKFKEFLFAKNFETSVDNILNIQKQMQHFKLVFWDLCFPVANLLKSYQLQCSMQNSISITRYLCKFN